MQRAGFGAAVEKRKDSCGAPDAFFGHRKSLLDFWGFAPKRLGDSFLGFDLDKKANFCYVPPISLTAQSGKDKKKKELFFYFHPISFVTKRDGVDGREKSRGEPPGPHRLSRLLPQTGFPNKDNRGFGKKSKRRKLWY